MFNLRTGQLNMLLWSACSLAHSFRAWLRLSALTIIFLWSPFTSAFGPGRPLKSVFQSCRHMLPTGETPMVVAEATVTVAHEDIWQILEVQEFDAVILVLLLCFILKFLVNPDGIVRFLLNPSDNPSIRMDLRATDERIRRLNSMLDMLDRKLDHLERKK